VNRAMAEFLRVDGAPWAEAERYLRRALDKRRGDAESNYAVGALLYREGRMGEARAKLELANTLQVGAMRKPLFRALYLLGKLDAQAVRKEEARRELPQLTGLTPQHGRGRNLLAAPEVPAPAASPAAAAAPLAGAPAVGAPAAGAPAAGVVPTAPGA